MTEPFQKADKAGELFLCSQVGVESQKEYYDVDCGDDKRCIRKEMSSVFLVLHEATDQSQKRIEKKYIQEQTPYY